MLTRATHSTLRCSHKRPINILKVNSDLDSVRTPTPLLQVMRQITRSLKRQTIPATVCSTWTAQWTHRVQSRIINLEPSTLLQTHKDQTTSPEVARIQVRLESLVAPSFLSQQILQATAETSPAKTAVQTQFSKIHSQPEEIWVKEAWCTIQCMAVFIKTNRVKDLKTAKQQLKWWRMVNQFILRLKIRQVLWLWVLLKLRLLRSSSNRQARSLALRLRAITECKVQATQRCQAWWPITTTLRSPAAILLSNHLPARSQSPTVSPPTPQTVRASLNLTPFPVQRPLPIRSWYNPSSRPFNLTDLIYLKFLHFKRMLIKNLL